MQIIIALLALSFLIIIHELGHFTAAKLSGIKVLEFALFMGPKIFSFQKGETVYSIRSVPLGGYVKMEGEEQASEDDRAYNRKPVWVRAIVIAAGPVANLLIAVIIISFMTFFTGYNTTTIDTVQPYSPAYEAGLQAGDKIVKYNNKTITHPADVSLFLFGTKGKPVKIEFMRDGEKIEKTLTPDIYEANRYLLGFSPKKAYGEGSNIVGTVSEENQGNTEGLRKGDEIIRMNDTAIKNNRDIRAFLTKNKGSSVKVTVLRDGVEKTLNITPQISKYPEQYDIGLGFKGEKGNVGQVIKQSFISSYSISRNVYYSLAWLITGRISFNQMSGPVGIVSTIGDVVQQSPTLLIKVLNLLNLTALISINLGLFNLIPFPALDGSKLILLLVEGVRRKAIPPEKEAMISMIGLALLIMLMIFATFNDVMRLAGG